MKKVIFLSSVLGLSLILTGCGTPKTSTNTDNVEAGTAGSASVTATVPNIDTSAFDSDYQKNFTQAQTSVNTYFQNQAKFCSVIVNFPGSSIQFADEYFFFTATNDAVKDWYGVIEIDPLVKTAKRQLAAKKDYADTIKCISSTSSTPPSFASAYSSFLASYPTAGGTNIAKTQMALMDNIWRITAWDASGAVIATQDVSTAADAAASKTATTSTTATTGL